MLLDAPEMLVGAVLGAVAQQDELGAVVQAVENRVPHQFQSLLCVQPANESDNRLLVLRQPKASSQGALVLILLVNGLSAVMSRNVRIGFRIPLIIVQPVENSAVLVVMKIQCPFQSVCLPAVFGLPGMARGDSGDEIRIDNPAFHQIESLRILVVPQAVVVEKMLGPMKAGGPEKELSANPLMAEIVDRETNAGMPHAQVLIDFVKQHRYKGRLPIVAMNDLRLLARFEHELEGGPAKKGESERIIVVSVNGSAVEEVVAGMRLDEKAFAPVHEAEPDRSGDAAVVPRNPQVFVGLGQPKNLVVTHAVILGQKDLQCVAAQFQRPAQSVHHVGQTAHFGYRRQFWRDHHD